MTIFGLPSIKLPSWYPLTDSRTTLGVFELRGMSAETIVMRLL